MPISSCPIWRAGAFWRAAALSTLLATALLLNSCGGGGGGGDGGGGGTGSGATTSAPSGASNSCPLTDQQTQKSVDAWAKIAQFLTSEPRCVNCHGAVNPYIAGVGVESAVDTDGTLVPVSKVEHGGGQIDRPKTSDGTVQNLECVGCHDDMVRPHGENTPAVWTLPLASHSFVDKDATTLCRQIKGALGTAAHFIRHMEDDEGLTDFVDTAFKGNRGLSIEPKEYEPPSIPKGAFLQMGHDWVDAMGGEFRGDVSCGCEVRHSAWTGQIHSAVQTDVQRERANGVATGRSLGTVNISVIDNIGKHRGEFTLHYKDPEASWDGAPITEATEGSGDGIIPVQLQVDGAGNLGGTYSISLLYPSEPIEQDVIGTQTDTYCSTRYGTCGSTSQSVLMPQVPSSSVPVGSGSRPLTGTVTDLDHIKGSWMWAGGAENSPFGRVQNVVTVDLWRSP